MHLLPPEPKLHHLFTLLLLLLLLRDLLLCCVVLHKNLFSYRVCV